MTTRYLPRDRPDPGPGSSLGAAWPAIFQRYGELVEACLLHEALATLWEFVAAANRYVDATQPWVVARAATDGDTAAAAHLRDVLGDLLEACRVISVAAAPFLPQTAQRACAQLGVNYPYAPDGNAGPMLAEVVAWGSAAVGGMPGTPAPLFPRLDLETAAPA